MSESYYLSTVKQFRTEIHELQLNFLEFLNDRIINCSQTEENRKNLLEVVSLNFTLLNTDKMILFKPRFTPAKQLLPNALRIKAIHQYEKIKIHFDEYPFYQVPPEILNLFIIHPDNSSYKHSFFCLVEDQVHKTDEIYGDYLGIISKSESSLKVSIRSTRREELRENVCNEKIFRDLDEICSFLNDYVVKRMKEELSNRFSYLDSILKRGEDNYLQLSVKYPKIQSSYDTTKILEIGEKRLYINLFDGLFYLGYAMEHWVKKYVLDNYHMNMNNEKLFRVLKFIGRKNTLIPFDIDLLHQIRIEYNNLRHEPEYIINFNKILDFYGKFTDFVSRI